MRNGNWQLFSFDGHRFRTVVRLLRHTYSLRLFIRVVRPKGIRKTIPHGGMTLHGHKRPNRSRGCHAGSRMEARELRDSYARSSFLNRRVHSGGMPSTPISSPPVSSASRIDQTWVSPQHGHFSRVLMGGMKLTQDASVSIPVNAGRPVAGHLIMTMAMFGSGKAASFARREYA